MAYDFYADEYCKIDKANIDRVVNGSGQFKDITWSAKAQILATCCGGSLESIAKQGDGKGRDHKIKGYPGIFLGDTCNCAPGWITTVATDNLQLLPPGSCLIQCQLRLLTPFYSRDDRAFYPTENPIKREWVFHAPYLAASGVKGLLRWALRLNENRQKCNSTEEFLFGSEKGLDADAAAVQGHLRVWPLFWQGKVGQEYLNPQDRIKANGTVPISYEVVQPGATATLSMLVVNPAFQQGFAQDEVTALLKALAHLQQVGGFSAKQSADWGSFKLENTSAYISGYNQQENTTDTATDKQEDMAEYWDKVVDANGELLPFDNPAYTKKIKAKLSNLSEKQLKKHQEKIEKNIKENYQAYKDTQQPPSQPEQPAQQAQLQKIKADGLDDLLAKIGDAYQIMQGGNNDC